MTERENLLARDVMSVPVLSIPPAAAVDGIVRIMRDHAISALPVTDKSGRPVGIVTQSDLSAAVAADQRLDRQTAAALMTSPVHTIQSDTQISVIAELFETHHVQHALVMSGDRLIGIVSATDLADRVLQVGAQTRVDSDERLRKLIIASLRAAEPSLAELPDFSISEGIVHFWGVPPTAEELEAVVRAASAANF